MKKVQLNVDYGLLFKYPKEEIKFDKKNRKSKQMSIASEK